MGRRHSCDVGGGEQRRELELRHDLDVLVLEVGRAAAGKMWRVIVRAMVGVHVCDLCRGWRGREGGVRE